jgi:glycosyltransferase involved in cell wall biosynthesis
VALRRVGLNALFLDPGVSGGSETYLRQLVPAMARARPDLRFELATTRRGAETLRSEGWTDSLALVALPCDDDEPVRRTAIEQLVLPRLARRRGWDVLHSLSNRGPRRPGAASVVTIHDVIFFEHRTMGVVSTYGMRWAVRAAAAGARELIAISASAADEIATVLGVDRSRITAIPHGPGRAPPEVAPGERGPGPASGRVVLCVAAKRRHKNQGLLVGALPLLPADVQAVLVGHDEGYGRELAAAAGEAGVADRVHLLDYTTDEELEALWRDCACAAFPTLAEGFGLPVLEALRRGVPVACSDLPVLREVAGDAAHYFDPNDPRSAAAAIEAALADDTAGERGPARAAGFSWERAAERTLEVYERAHASG